MSGVRRVATAVLDAAAARDAASHPTRSVLLSCRFSVVSSLSVAHCQLPGEVATRLFLARSSTALPCE